MRIRVLPTLLALLSPLFPAAAYADGPAPVEIPSVRVPQVDIPGAEVPIVDVPGTELPIIAAPGITVPGIEVREGEGIALIRMAGDVLFDFDKSDIRPDAATALNEVLALIGSRYPDADFTIHGHTDAMGSHSYNMRLSQARSEAVRDWLIANGVAADRMSIQAHGESRPIAPNANADGSDNPAGRALNRRVEIAVALPGAR